LVLLPLTSCLVLLLVLLLILHLLPCCFNDRFLNKHTTTPFPMVRLPLFCFMQINHGTRILLICLLEQHTILGSPVPGPIKSLVQTSIPQHPRHPPPSAGDNIYLYSSNIVHRPKLKTSPTCAYEYPLAIGRDTRSFIHSTTQERGDRSRVGTHTTQSR
jgi:hypothetical protein